MDEVVKYRSQLIKEYYLMKYSRDSLIVEYVSNPKRINNEIREYNWGEMLVDDKVVDSLTHVICVECKINCGIQYKQCYYIRNEI